MERLPISAVIVSHNEAHLLRKSLPIIAMHCAEVILIDLSSDDDPEEVARGYVSSFIVHPKVPLVEVIHAAFQFKTKFDWLLVSDPDEVISADLFDILRRMFPFGGSVGAVAVPIMYFFKGRALRGTNWGGVTSRILLAHRHRFVFTSDVHNGRKLKPGFDLLRIDYTSNGFITHYWCDSYASLLKKHFRYLKFEGESRFKSGQRYRGLRQLLVESLRAFRSSYILKRGYQDGLTGLLLSVIWAIYVCGSLLSLRKFQRPLRN